MNLPALHATAAWWASHTPVLPAPEAMQWGLQASWSVVLAWLGAALAARWTRAPAVPMGVAAALAASAWLPGQASASYWLGLAFQTPSITAVLLCALWLGQHGLRCRAGGGGPAAQAAAGVQARVQPTAVWAALGVILGWALLLDTLALLPVQLYAWGFSPLAPVLALLLGGLAWLLPGQGRNPGPQAVVWGLAVLLFVGLRLPSGNLWDAVLDPWLWLALHIPVVRRLRLCYQKKSCLRSLGGR